MEKNNKTLSVIKDASISALIGHALAIFILFLISTALVKNEDPSALMPVGALLAFFVGSLVCGTLAGKRIDGLFGGGIAGGIYTLLLVAVSLLIRAFSDSDGDAVTYGFGFKIGMILGALILSFLVGLWINSRKSTKKSLAKHRKKVLGR